MNNILWTICLKMFFSKIFKIPFIDEGKSFNCLEIAGLLSFSDFKTIHLQFSVSYPFTNNVIKQNNFHSINHNNWIWNNKLMDISSTATFDKLRIPIFGISHPRSLDSIPKWLWNNYWISSKYYFNR